MSDATISTTLHELHEADGAPFSELVAIAGLKPSEDFRDADLRGIDFAESDLTGYDFSGADLSGASFVGARIDRARFGNANLSDTVWPAGWHSSSEHPGAPRTVLSPLQTEIVNRLTQDLRQTAPGRAIASLPNGIGQTSIMSAVLSDLQASYELRSVLVLTETIAERERIVSGLRHMGFRVSPDRSGFSENAAPEPGEFRVETFSNVHRHLQLLERRHDPHGLDLGFSHIVLTSLPNRRSVDIAALANQPTPPAMLAFSQPFSVTFDAEDRLVGDEIREVFPIRAVVCSFEDALSGGLLEPVEIMIKDGLLNDDAPMTSAGVGDTMSRLDQVVYDFVQELTEIPFEVPAVLIAPTIDSVDRLVNILDETVHFAPAGNSRRRPVAISSRHKREAARFRRDGEGLIAVMTPQMLDGFDIGDTGLIGILAKLPKRHMAKLAFAPASRPRRLVIDYSSETPFTNWASLVRPVDELSKPNSVPM